MTPPGLRGLTRQELLERIQIVTQRATIAEDKVVELTRETETLTVENQRLVF